METNKTELMTASECILKHNLGYQVEKVPVSVAEGVLNDYVAIRHEESKYVFQVAGAGYTPVQNTEAFTFFDKITGTGYAKYERAGSFKKGGIVWIQARVPHEFDVVKGDKVDTFLTLINSHDGSYPISIYPTTIRIICQNTLQAGYANAVKKIKAKHTENVKTNFVLNAEALMTSERQYFIAFAEKCKALAAKQMKQIEMDSFLSELFNSKDNEDSARVKNQMDSIKQLHEVGKGADIQGVRGTAWGAYNAVTEYIDSYRATKGEASNRTFSSWLGSGNQMREKAFELLLKA